MTQLAKNARGAQRILIHTKREARDEVRRQRDIHFNPHEARSSWLARIFYTEHIERILIHTKREARDIHLITAHQNKMILIHTKREARDHLAVW